MPRESKMGAQQSASSTWTLNSDAVPDTDAQRAHRQRAIATLRALFAERVQAPECTLDAPDTDAQRPMQRLLREHTYVLSLDRHAPRWHHARAALQQLRLCPRRVRAIDASTEAPLLQHALQRMDAARLFGDAGARHNLLFGMRAPASLTDGERACALSHAAVWARMFHAAPPPAATSVAPAPYAQWRTGQQTDVPAGDASGGENAPDAVLVFEDDIHTYVCAERLAEELARAMRTLRDTRWDVLFLGRCSDQCGAATRIDENLYRVYAPLCAHAYVLRRSGATVLLREPWRSAIDMEIQRHCRAGTLHAYALHPSMFVQDVLRWESSLRAAHRTYANAHDCAL